MSSFRLIVRRLHVFLDLAVLDEADHAFFELLPFKMAVIYFHWRCSPFRLMVVLDCQIFNWRILFPNPYFHSSEDFIIIDFDSFVLFPIDGNFSNDDQLLVLIDLHEFLLVLFVSMPFEAEFPLVVDDEFVFGGELLHVGSIYAQVEGILSDEGEGIVFELVEDAACFRDVVYLNLIEVSFQIVVAQLRGYVREEVGEVGEGIDREDSLEGLHLQLFEDEFLWDDVINVLIDDSVSEIFRGNGRIWFHQQSIKNQINFINVVAIIQLVAGHFGQSEYERGEIASYYSQFWFEQY